MISVQDWKTSKCAITEDTDHVKAIEALASLLGGNIFPADAAKSITTAYAASLKATKGGDNHNSWYETKVAQFWGSDMFDAIACYGGTDVQARLISLLVEISKLPDLKDDHGVVVKTIHHQTFRSDLPGWGRHFASAGLGKLHHNLLIDVC